MIAARQIDLPLAIPAMRPLLPVEAVMVLADCDEDYVLTLIDLGFLVAFDIRSSGAERRELRIWRESLIWFLEHRSQLDLTIKVQSSKVRVPTHEEALIHLFPHARERLRSPEVQRLFSCSQTHVAQLLADSLLDAENESRPGPNGYVWILRTSISAFLTRRIESAATTKTK